MQARRARGTAMAEMVLIVPILGLLVGLAFFFGWALMHKHQVLVADRYSAWQRIETGAWPSTDKINDVAFNRTASSVNLSARQPVTETVLDLVSQAQARGSQPGELADELIHQRFPPGAVAQVSADWNSKHALWERFTGAITHSSGREGVTWRRDEVDCWNTLRDLYYPGLDNALQHIPPPADRMANMIRGLYLAHW